MQPSDSKSLKSRGDTQGVCPGCNKPNACMMASHGASINITQCWCMGEARQINAVPTALGRLDESDACYCQSCLRARRHPGVM